MKAPIPAVEIPARTKPTTYPEPFASKMKGRVKRTLGDHFGISKFGVNLTHLSPGSISALFHKHSKQEEFIYILQGNPTLRIGENEFQLSAGQCAGFTPDGEAHQLINNSSHDVVYLEIGDRESGDEGTYPEDDLVASLGEANQWVFKHKNGDSY